MNQDLIRTSSPPRIASPHSPASAEVFQWSRRPLAFCPEKWYNGLAVEGWGAQPPPKVCTDAWRAPRRTHAHPYAYPRAGRARSVERPSRRKGYRWPSSFRKLGPRSSDWSSCAGRKHTSVREFVAQDGEPLWAIRAEQLIPERMAFFAKDTHLADAANLHCLTMPIVPQIMGNRNPRSRRLGMSGGDCGNDKASWHECCDGVRGEVRAPLSKCIDIGNKRPALPEGRKGKAEQQPPGVLPRLTGYPGISSSSALCEMSQFLPWLFSQSYPLKDVPVSTLMFLAVLPSVRCPRFLPVMYNRFAPY